MALKILGKGKRVARQRRHLRLRKKVAGSAARPRLVVTRSARHISAQVVDDGIGQTIVSASTLEADLRSSNERTRAQAVRALSTSGYPDVAPALMPLLVGGVVGVGPVLVGVRVGVAPPVVGVAVGLVPPQVRQT